MRVLAAPLRAVGQPVRRFLKPVWYRLFRFHPFHYLGAIYWATMSQPARDHFVATRFLAGANLGLRERCLRTYLDDCYYAQHADSSTTPDANRSRWSGPSGQEYHRAMLQHYTENPEEFDRQHASLLARMKELLAAQTYECVVEIGCGNGLLIERVASLAPEASTVFVGLDMDPATIASNRQRYAGSRVQFHQSNTLQEFLAGRRPLSVLVYASGAAAFFTPGELVNLLTWLRSNVPRGAVVVGDITHLEVEREQQSRPLGGYSFHHNYGFLFAQAGLDDNQCQYEPVPDYPLQAVVASASWGRVQEAS